MKKIGILTIYDNNNFGNRLQNYALCQILIKLNNDVYTFKNFRRTNFKNSIIRTNILFCLVYVNDLIKNMKRIKKYLKFVDFNKNIKFYKKYVTNCNLKKVSNEFDYIVVGSDQVWNPYLLRLSDVDLLSGVDSKKRIAYSASFAIDSLPENNIDNVVNELKKFSAISVRENAGKELINKYLGVNKAEVLIDPTLLLESSEWEKLCRKPKNFSSKKYVLKYFLGSTSKEYEDQIEKFAVENECDIINVLDYDDIGPSEFLYLEKNAYLICTDSFHSSVFAMLFENPFVIFERNDSLVKMNSRLDTLITTFKLKDRKYNGNLNNNVLKCEYKVAYEILKKEKEKSIKFLKTTLK